MLRQLTARAATTVAASHRRCYSVLELPVDRNAPAFQNNYKAMKSQVDALRDLTAKILEGGPAELKARHRERNKMLARERVDALLDVGCVACVCVCCVCMCSLCECACDVFVFCR